MDDKTLADEPRDPTVATMADQWWFWTPEWQAGEREATEEARRGEGERHERDAEFLAALKRTHEQYGGAFDRLAKQ